MIPFRSTANTVEKFVCGGVYVRVVVGDGGLRTYFALNSEDLEICTRAEGLSSGQLESLGRALEAATLVVAEREDRLDHVSCIRRLKRLGPSCLRRKRH